MYQKENFKFGNNYKGWFVYVPKLRWEYLLINKTVKSWNKLLSQDSLVEAETLMYYKTKQKAQENLNEFLKGQEMNDLESRKNQCIADIGVLQANLAEIHEEIEKSKDLLNKIREYISKNKCYSYTPDIENINGVNYVVVRVPCCNNQWTFAVWDWAKKFCEHFDRGGNHCYPIHGYSFQDRNVWIKV